MKIADVSIRRPVFAVMLIGAGCVLKLGTGVAFLAAVAASVAFRWSK